MKHLLFSCSLMLSQLLISQTVTNKIVVDQFGYRTTAKKHAVLRNPVTGFDATETYTPGVNFSVNNATTDGAVYTGSPVIWNGGAEDASSGDKAWTFDFSSVVTPGKYYVLDIDNQVKSYEFEIKDHIYNEILKHAVRVFFYQRSGFEKQAQFAGSNWADGASHLGPLQDLNCRKWDEPNNAAKEKDVHGGWYDAGDLNKYTTWTANYIVELLRAYRENPSVWTDDYNIPESGNGTPDILDETKWGIDHLLRLQFNDGSLISVISAAHASPPSAATGASLYGNVNTSSTLSASGTYALSALVFKSIGNTIYADTLEARAIKAWNWANGNPAVLWKNNNDASGTKGIAAGQAEVDDYGRLKYKLRAALYLFELTGDNQYKTYFDNNYNQLHLIQWKYVYPFEDEEQDIVLEYSKLPNATVSVKNNITSTFVTAMDKADNFPAFENNTDPYRAYIKDYTWGSNRQKCSQGLSYWEVDYFGFYPSKAAIGLEAAEEYIHYMHGVNPLGMVYLTNMGQYGAEKSANQIYHTWFAEGSDWDDASSSLYGPAPGIVPGGPNPNYKVDGCCPSGCGSAANNAKCSAIDLSTLLNQPKQKSYLDFNNSWPLNSWEVTENSMGYQVEYIRLLSKFVSAGIPTNTIQKENIQGFNVYPNPAQSVVYFNNLSNPLVELLDGNGKVVLQTSSAQHMDISNLSSGIYFIKNDNEVVKFHKN